MKKRWLSLLAAICFICTMSGTVFAAESTDFVGVGEDDIIPESEIAAFSEDGAIVTYHGNTQIETYNSGGNTIASVSGVNRSRLLKWLTKHINDTYYLTTPYRGGDYRNPNGSGSGIPGMNCTGFVWHALTSAGGSGVPGIQQWPAYLRNNGIEYRTYTGDDVDDIIDTIVYEDNYAEPGDVIWTWDANAGGVVNGISNGSSPVHHTGLFTGTYFDSMPHNYNYDKTPDDPNGFWHSGNGTNQITNITPLSRCAAITVIKLGGELPLATFYDVADTGWYTPYVLDVSSKGLMTGYNTSYFGTNDNLTRGQFATILYRISGSPATDYQAIFNDVPDGRFDSLPVTWANQSGIVTGYADNIFRPNSEISREEMATMLQRYAETIGEDISARADLVQFPDSSSVSTFAIDAMQWAVASGIISGNLDGTLAPQGKVSRAVCATIISRYASPASSSQ